MAISPPLTRATALLAVLLAAPALGQEPGLDTIPVASVDLYGLRTVPDSAVRRAVGITPGAPIPDSAARAAAIARVEALPGVSRARLEPVCCTAAGGLMLYVGVEETGAPTLRSAPAPSGAVRLPPEVLAAGDAFERAFAEAIAHRDFAEMDTAGHALMHWPAARAVQLRFVDLAARYAPELRDVLHHAADPAQRALAAQVLGYVADKGTVVEDLATALRDPDETVRNNATRALWLTALLGQRRPELGIHVPYEPLVAMLGSPVWTDRNKASLALMQLTASRDPALLALLRARSLPALVEMANWQNIGHAGAALMILGRLAGMSDEEIAGALQRGEREPILRAAAGIAGRAP
ncbi:MAG TPA: HEAT repeat domain-containing protein [Longimicrobiales bacterium]|nr:HEAT repeat domain-containing protein [Longimicrobiales bacterium]